MNNRFLIVVFNGPPRSGKDAIISKLMTATTPYCILNHRHIQGWHEKMIMPLRDIVCNLFNIGGLTYEMQKDEPILFNEVTPRQAIMALDTLWAREVFGEEFLGYLLVKELEKHHKNSKPPFEFKDQVNVHFVDAGVEAEFQVLKSAYGNKVKVIHIYRTDLYFDDSRNWLSQCDGVIHNDAGNTDEAVNKALLLINGWLGELDDKVDGGTTTGIPEEVASSQS